MLLGIGGPIVSVTAAEVNKDYAIGSGDTIQFQVYEEPDVLAVQRVSATGEIRVPLIGTVKVAGLTLRQAEKKLRDLLVEGEYFVDPLIILTLQQYGDRSISVLGQVNRPDEIKLTQEVGSIGIIQAITAAGGLSRLAKTDTVQVVRTHSDGREERLIVNLDLLLTKASASAAGQFQVLPGDIVFVPERSF